MPTGTGTLRTGAELSRSSSRLVVRPEEPVEGWGTKLAKIAFLAASIVGFVFYFGKSLGISNYWESTTNRNPATQSEKIDPPVVESEPNA
jgi:hypothetical protein